MGKGENVAIGGTVITIGTGLTMKAEALAIGATCYGTTGVAFTTGVIAGTGIGLVLVGGIFITYTLFGKDNGKDKKD